VLNIEDALLGCQLVLMKQLLQKPLRYKAVAQKTRSSP